jgi:hypothetical protein
MAERSIEEVARWLASQHARQDPGLVAVIWVQDLAEVMLIEVTESVGSGCGVAPFRYAPDPPDVPYPSVLVLLTPDEWEYPGQLTWPDAWSCPPHVLLYERGGRPSGR